MLLLLLACATAEPDAPLLAALEDGEWLPGGETTNTLLLGSNAFTMPAANLDAQDEAAFYSGNSFFNQAWVEAPASTESRDGLGPLFNASSCSGCHFKDGRAGPPAGPEDDILGMLVRLSVPGLSEHGGPLGDPVYGGQLQDRANEGLPPEVRVRISWQELPGEYDDGTAYSLRRPLVEIDELAWGELDPDVMLSLRAAPMVIGLGLLQAIPDERLAELEDPEDLDGDGIAGHRNQVWEPASGQLMTGRFGWKAEQATVLAQSMGAFAGDMGLTSWVVEADDCTDAQPECLDADTGGDPEVEDVITEKVDIYASVLAPPVRRDWDTDTVLRGKYLFAELGCDGCHVPSHTTGEHQISGLEDQLIWPYTDLLLHDLGPDLADERPLYEASGREWRTPPLWGLGLVPQVNGHLELLHDGRARGFEEAILWHGGEAEDARDAFKALAADDREALVTFLGSL